MFDPIMRAFSAVPANSAQVLNYTTGLQCRCYKTLSALHLDSSTMPLSACDVVIVCVSEHAPHITTKHQDAVASLEQQPRAFASTRGAHYC
jgi:hypothetical protein